MTSQVAWRQTPSRLPRLLVTLPHARALVRPGAHHPGRGGFREVMIQERRGSTQIRFLLAPDTPAPSIHLGDDEVRVTLPARCAISVIRSSTECASASIPCHAASGEF